MNVHYIEKLMNLKLKNSPFLILIFIFTLKVASAQFLDKKFYLLDSLNEEKISKPDFDILKTYLSKYNESTADTTKHKILSELVENLNDEKLWPRYNFYNYQKLKLLIENTNDKTEKIKFTQLYASAINNIGYYEQNYLGNIKNALNLYDQAEKIQWSINDYKGLLVTKNNIANILHNIGQTAKAIEIYNEVLQFVNKNKLNADISPIYNNLADIYLFLGDTIKATNCLQNSLSIAIKYNQKATIAQLLGNIGVVLRNQNKEKLAITYFRRSLTIREEIGDKIGVCKSNLNLAKMYALNGQFNLANEHLKNAEPIAIESKNPYIKYLFYSAKYLQSLQTNNLTESINYSELALKFNKEQGDLSDELVLHQGLQDLYIKTNQYKKALFSVLRIQEIQKIMNSANFKRNYIKGKVEREFKKREDALKETQKLNELKAAQKQKQQSIIIISVVILLIATFIFSVFIFKALKANKLKNKIITEQKIEVEKQKIKIEENAIEIASKHKDLTDSINYAKRIQSALIPSQEDINTIEPKLSLFFQPRDVVSGDFYWASKINNQFVFALADCTGHGVPGAFMSIIGINHLNSIINELQITQPNLILNELKKRIIHSLNIHNTDEAKRDGMDIALISILNNKLLFSGANQTIYVLRNNSELLPIKGDKQPIGLSDFNADFVLNEFDLQINDRIILFTDGIVDQFGGELGKKLKINALKNWVLESANFNLEKQKIYIKEKLNNFKGNIEQTDDISFAIIQH